MGLLVAGKLIRIDHRQHLAEALADPGNPLCWISERQLVPWHEFDLLAHHVGQVFLAGCAGETTQRLRAEHCFFIALVAATTAHDQAVEILNLTLVELKGLFGLGLVGELLGQSHHNLVKAVLKELLQLAELRKIRLLVQSVLHVFHPPQDILNLPLKLSHAPVKVVDEPVVNVIRCHWVRVRQARNVSLELLKCLLDNLNSDYNGSKVTALVTSLKLCKLRTECFKQGS